MRISSIPARSTSTRLCSTGWSQTAPSSIGSNDIDIWTCDGREHWPVYRVKDRPLSIENEQGRQIVETDDFHLIVKSANTCGGIADMPEPAAQLGASFLSLFGDVIFDPRNTTVWLGGPRPETRGGQ